LDGSNGLADDWVADLKRFEEEIFNFIENSHPAFCNLREKKQSTTI
jgi:hypothetical protein